MGVRIYMSPDPAPMQWATAPDMLTARSRFGCVSVGARVYALGGVDGVGAVIATCEVFDRTTGSWSAISPMPVPKAAMACCADLDGRLYVAGGLNLGLAETDSAYRYEPDTDTWAAVTDLPDAIAYAQMLCGHDGALYFVGGEQGVTTFADTYQYRPIPTRYLWRGSYSGGTAYDTGDAVSTGGVTYVALAPSTGITPPSVTYWLATPYNQWLAQAPLQDWGVDTQPQARTRYAMTRDAYGRIYVIGGTDGIAAQTSVYRYNPLCNAWHRLAPLPLTYPEMGAAQTPAGEMFVFGGNDGGSGASTAYRYSARDNLWSPVTAAMAQGRLALGGAADDLGQVYAIGGRATALGSALISVERSNAQTKPYYRMDDKRGGISEIYSKDGQGWKTLSLQQTITSPMDTAGFTLRFYQTPAPTWARGEARTETYIVDDDEVGYTWSAFPASPSYREVYGEQGTWDSPGTWQLYRLLFGGYLSNIKNHDVLTFAPIYDYQAQNWQAALEKNTFINEYYQGMYDADIVADILTNRGVRGGFRVGQMQRDHLVPRQPFSQVSPLEAINELVGRTNGYRFSVDAYKYCSFYNPTPGEPRVSLRTDIPPGDMTSPRMYGWQMEIDLTQLRRAELVVGGTQRVPRVDILTQPRPTRTFYTPFKPYPITAELATVPEAQWARGASMLTNRMEAAACRGGAGGAADALYVFGGSNGAALDSVEAYRRSVGWYYRTPMPGGARTALACAPDTAGRLYLIGGYDGGRLDRNERYTPTTDGWDTMAVMPTPRYRHGAALGYTGKIYVAGGNDAGGVSSVLEIYDPASDTWATGANMPTARQSAAVLQGPDGRIYVIGGHNGTTAVSTVERYEIGSNTWTARASLPVALQGVTAQMGSDGYLYVFGGSSSNAVPIAAGLVDTVYRYSVDTDTWTLVTKMPTARALCCAATDSLGAMYVLGGYVGGGSPQTNAVEQTADVVWQRLNINLDTPETGYDVTVDSNAMAWVFRYEVPTGQMVRLTYTYDTSALRNVTTAPSEGLYWNVKVSDQNIADGQSAGNRAAADLAQYEDGARSYEVIVTRRYGVNAGDTIHVYNHVDAVNRTLIVQEMRLVQIGATRTRNPDDMVGGYPIGKLGWSFKCGDYVMMAQQLLGKIVQKQAQTATTDPGPDSLTSAAALTLTCWQGGFDDSDPDYRNWTAARYGAIENPNWGSVTDAPTGAYYPAGALTRWGERAWQNERPWP